MLLLVGMQYLLMEVAFQCWQQTRGCESCVPVSQSRIDRSGLVQGYLAGRQDVREQERDQRRDQGLSLLHRARQPLRRPRSLPAPEEMVNKTSGSRFCLLAGTPGQRQAHGGTCGCLMQQGLVTWMAEMIRTAIGNLPQRPEQHGGRLCLAAQQLEFHPQNLNVSLCSSHTRWADVVATTLSPSSIGTWLARPARDVHVDFSNVQPHRKQHMRAIHPQHSFSS